jgi:hypothetical protein
MYADKTMVIVNNCVYNPRRVYACVCVVSKFNIQYADITKDNVDTYTLVSLNDTIW